jgi:AraC-like DNA-binding protein
MPQSLLRYREVAPPADLCDWVEAFWFIETLAPAAGALNHWVLPESSVNLVFWLPGGWRRPESLFHPILAGPTRQAYRKPGVPGEAYVGVRFLPAAGPAFLDCTGTELRSNIQPLKLVQPRWADRLADRLAHARSEAAALCELVAELRTLVATRPACDQRMVAAAAWYRRAPAAVDLARWGDAFGLSERQFRRRFQAAVGHTPRDFRRIVRMQKLVREGLLQPSVAWAALAARSGYADQAHLANEFRSLSGGRATSYHEHIQRIEHAMAEPNGRFFQDIRAPRR